ncbi:hypothetical protein Bca52824_096244 [Brassica carinata]|uniref:Uncharacterized protein n=1 Tax=Brassica carinata TaxID=52824 RepID=A0A8X7P0Z5_BRACI|nr:hypothetical protein Bca52824_096244 [Brassica carinata]
MKNDKCDTWCELESRGTIEVFERKLRPKPSGRGHVPVSQIAAPNPLEDIGRKLVSVLPHAVGQNPS